ncbi:MULTISPECIES: BACON domain-containing protein [Streptomyces]|uniref:BACON domain-containing protein n=1 Tax=Streptomyces TaxID=1883 RepID=UPI0022496F5D|nr:sigma-70 family RNA polymerase sigma factor [Streptomyces sp. JHD 1]MCX2970713.1 sigma-70 family RNA polymerase sigma factor [Streptomyces sp. JHD 1]
MTRREQLPDRTGAHRARRAAPRAGTQAAAAGEPGGDRRAAGQAKRSAKQAAKKQAAKQAAKQTARQPAKHSAKHSARHGAGSGTGMHRASGRSGGSGRRPGHSEERPPAHFDAYLDGLFSYCLSVMCDHDAAIAALGEALAVAERQRLRDRAPADPAAHRPWLYALTRWSCLRRLSAGTPPRAEGPPLSGPAADQRRRELGALAWPEAAGTAPEQREALELAVRHQLPVHEVAAVLGKSEDAARALLSSGACEVERTRAALAVVATGGCPTVARIAADHEVLLGTALCRELVRHVDACPLCRRAAERSTAGQPWPGTAPTGSGTLPVLAAPRAAVHAALRGALRARMLHTPRFDRRGFPVTDRDRAARRERLRSRAVTTTVVATVIAAPVLAVWAAYRGAPLTGEAREGASVAAVESEDADGTPDGAAPEGGQRSHGDHGPVSGEDAESRVGVSVTAQAEPGRDDERPGRPPADRTVTPPPAGGATTAPAPGRVEVEAATSGDATHVTLTASGGSPVTWSAAADAPWLRLSHASGTLAPGESTTITVTVDADTEPSGPWTAHIHLAPAGAVITVEGQGRTPEPGPTEPPEEPAPTPTEPEPSPSDSPSPSAAD